MSTEEHDSPPTGHTLVDDQIGGYGEEAAATRGDQQSAAYPGDEHDFATEHMRPTFSDEMADSAAVRPERETPKGMSGMDPS